MSTIEITAQNLESEIAKKGILVLDFWAEWCGPCRQFAPIFEAASERHPTIVFGKVNTEEQQEVASAFAVQAIPTLALFREGVLLYAQPGMMPGPALDQLLAKISELDMNEVRRKLDEHEGHEGEEEEDEEGE